MYHLQLCCTLPIYFDIVLHFSYRFTSHLKFYCVSVLSLLICHQNIEIQKKFRRYFAESLIIFEFLRNHDWGMTINRPTYSPENFQLEYFSPIMSVKHTRWDEYRMLFKVPYAFRGVEEITPHKLLHSNEHLIFLKSNTIAWMMAF